MTKYTGSYPSIYKVIDNGQKIGDKANELAYPNNPKVAQYPSGHATEAFQKAQKKVYKGKYWSDASRRGASCDVFTGISVRASGIDPNIPVGLWKIQRYMYAHPEIYTKYTNMTKDKLQDGDIIIYRKAVVGLHGHICIYYKGKIKEASAKHFFGRTTNMVDTRLSKVGKKYVHVYRVKDAQMYTPLQKGSKGSEVEKLQKYINWYFGKDTLKVDGIFGSLTLTQVKLLQKKLKTKQDGIVGKTTLAKMKAAQK